MEENTQKIPEELMAEIERLNAENAKLKQATTNASADASKYEKEAADVRERLNAKLTEQEKAEAERADRDAKRKARDLCNARQYEGRYIHFRHRSGGTCKGRMVSSRCFCTKHGRPFQE